MVPVLETPRLWLKPLELADAPAIQALFPHWEIVRCLASVPWPYPPDGALAYLREAVLPAMARGDGWHWSLRPRTDPGTLIGCISLTRGDQENRGFWLGLPWQGQGLMTEASEAVNAFWFETLGFALLRVPKAAGNAASRRISQKNGMRLVATGEREHVGGRMPTEVWELTAEEWRRSTR